MWLKLHVDIHYTNVKQHCTMVICADTSFVNCFFLFDKNLE